MSPKGASALLDDDVREMNALAEKSRSYNALTHNCTTTIWHHARAVGSDFPTDWRLLANGYLIDLAYERGLVNTDIGLEEFNRRSDITERARTADIGEGFSEAIREEMPARFQKGTPDATAIEWRDLRECASAADSNSAQPIS